MSSAAAERWGRFAPWALAALFVALLLPKIAAGTLWQNDELLTANRSREMLVRGDPLAVTLNFTPDFKKPPLQYWITAASLAALPEWREAAVRLPALLFGAGCLVALAWLARVSSNPETGGQPGDANSLGAWSAGALMGCGFFIHMAQVGLLDCGAAFFLLLALVGCARAEQDARWWHLVAVAAVLGAWQKVPYGFGVWAIVLAHRMTRDRAGTWQRGGWHLPVALALALALALLWPALQWLRFGTEPIGKAWGEQIAAMGQAHHREDRGFQPWRYWYWLVRSWGAVGALAPLAVVAALWRGRRTGGATFEIAGVCAVYGLALIAVPFRVERYLIPVTPLLALLTVGEVWRRAPAGRVRTVALIVLIGSTVPSAAFNFFKRPPPARPELRELARSLGSEAAAANGAEVFLNIRLERGFNTTGFMLFYAEFPRKVRLIRPKRMRVLLRTTRSPTGRLGVGRRLDTAEGSAETVSTHGDWRVWRQAPAAGGATVAASP